MGDAIATLMGLQTATAGKTVQDMLNRAAPGLSFMPSFFRKWLQVDISAMIGLLSLISAMSSGFHFLNRIGLKLYWTLTRFCTASVTIGASDNLKREVLNWLSSTVLMRQGTRVLSAHSESAYQERFYYRIQTFRDDCANGKRRPIDYMPTFSGTWFWHRKRLFVIRCVRTRAVSGGKNSSEQYFDAPKGDEPLVIMCFGRSVAPIKQFLDDCCDWGEAQRARYVTVRNCRRGYSGWLHWDSTTLRPRRPLHTVHLEEQMKDDLIADITNYLDPQTRRFYQQRGIPYRRGYLLHGPPGTGKTSLSLALASIFNLDLYLLHVPSISDDTELVSLFDELPPRCILLLEDIDAVGIPKRNELVASMAGLDHSDDHDGDGDDKKQRQEHDGKSKCTLSGLLNVLDGVASQEGRIVFMTSNLADKLDPALTRPGRVDRKIYLGNINQESTRLMFLRMYSETEDLNAAESSPDMTTETSEPGHQVVGETAPATISTLPLSTIGEKQDTVNLENLAAEFASHLPDDKLTPALIQGFLLSHRSAPLAARDGIQGFVQSELKKMEQARLKAQREREARASKRKSKALKQPNTPTKDAAKTNADGSADNANPAPEATEEMPAASSKSVAADASGDLSDAQAKSEATEGSKPIKKDGDCGDHTDDVDKDVFFVVKEHQDGEDGDVKKVASDN